MTSTALATAHSPAALAIRAGQIAWDDTQLAALTQLGIKDASDGDKSVFLHQCQRTGLDPFARQIYMIGRNEKKNERQGDRWVEKWTVKWTIQTGIEGWRVIRDRAERREGVRGILSRFTYYDPEGAEYKVWVRREPPVACEVTYTVIEASGREVPYTSVLRFSEYVQMKDGRAIAQWAPDAKPVHMLEKCTEADVYRRAFPQDFSGVYLDDAMPPQEAAPAAPPRGRVTAGEVIDRKPAREAEPDPIRHAAPAATSPATDSSTAPAADNPSDLPEDAPGSADPDGQLKRLHTIFSQLEIEDREERLAIAEAITGRKPLTGPTRGRSSKNLSYTEARSLVDTLDGFGSRDELVAHMTALEVAADREAGDD